MALKIVSITATLTVAAPIVVAYEDEVTGDSENVEIFIDQLGQYVNLFQAQIDEGEGIMAIAKSTVEINNQTIPVITITEELEL